MAIVHVTETNTRSGDINEKFQRTYTRTFKARTNDPNDGPALVRLAVMAQYSLTIGVTYQTEGEYDTGAYCKNISVQPDGDAKNWTITVQYGPPSENNSQEQQNPLSQPAQVSWSFGQFDRPIESAIDGEPILNTAGEPYNTQFYRDDSRPLLSVVRNEASFNAALAYNYRDTTNSDSFFGASPGQVKVSNISASRQYDPNFGYYWQVSYEFHFSSDGWKLKLNSQGLNELKDGKLEKIKVQSVNVTEPYPLDQSGKKVPAGSKNPGHEQEFKIYNETSFSVFNLG